MGRVGHTLLSLSVLAVLAGCDGPGVTENPSSSALSGDTSAITGANPNNPTTPRTTTPPRAMAVAMPASATANSAVLTTTVTTVYSINSPALASGGWQPTALLETADGNAGSPQVGFDASGNGFAAWTQENNVFVRRYIASSATWSAPVILDTRTEQAHQTHLAVDQQSGRAVVTWVQSNGIAQSLYASRFDIGTNTWSAPQLVETANGEVSPDGQNSALAVRGEHAAVAWRQHDGTAISIYLSRLVNGSWTAPALIDAIDDEPGLTPQVAIDANGSATVAWRQYSAADYENRIHARRWDGTTQTLGAVMQLDNNGDRQHRLACDTAGNVFLVWRGGGVFARRFDVTSGAWGSEITLDNRMGAVGDTELSVDGEGNAMVVWIEDDGVANSVYARRYSSFAGTWGNTQLLEQSNVSANIDRYATVSTSGNEAVVAWIEESADAYAIKMSAGVWGPVMPLETRAERAGELASTINAAGNAAVLWVQADGAAPSIYHALYLSSNFIVPSGATWQSIANTLYGVNSVEAGNALQAALGGGPLTAGMILSSLPATLSVTTPIPGYYTVQATDTWSHIAQTVYGVTDVAAIAQLRMLLGNPTLAAGVQLVVPTVVNYTTSGNYSAPLDWDLVNTTSTTHHPLDLNALTIPLNNWSPAQLLETDYANASGPNVAFDANGNGMAVWTQASDVIARRYTASTDTWSAPVILDTNPANAFTPKLAVDRTTGDAVVSWAQSDGVADSMYVSSFDASTNSWSAALLLENSNHAVDLGIGNSTIAKAGDHAAVTWLQSDGTSDAVYLSRLVAGTWTAAVAIDTETEPGLHTKVAIDANGNTTVIWRQFNAADGEFHIHSRRWDNTALAYSPVTKLDGDGDRYPRIALDAQGNGFAMWGGIGAYIRRLDGATGAWGPQMQLSGPGQAYNPEISVDASGNALTMWMEFDGTAQSVHARYYDAATASWGATALLENSNAPANLDNFSTVTLIDGSGVVAWIQQTGASQDLYAARFGNGVWGSATLLETRDERPAELASTIDTESNATVLWVQADGAAPSVYRARSVGTPYYLVPAGATWQSIANTLYGVDSADAGVALQAAMSNPTLTTGLHLESVPATLVLTPAVPTYYVVQSGDTWASIVLALYGASEVEAAAALQAALGNPTLTAGSWLVTPSTLNYTVDDEA